MIKKILTVVAIAVIVTGLLAMDRKMNPAGVTTDWGIAKDNPIKLQR
jgi:hypothetical protein